MKLKLLISGRKTRITNQVSEITPNAVINTERNNDVCSDPDCDITGLETHEELFHESGVEVNEPTTEHQNQDDEISNCDKCQLKVFIARII